MTTEAENTRGGQYLIPGTETLVSKSAQQLVTSALDNDEPVFVLRAKDIFSLPALQYYKLQVERYGPTNHGFQIDIENIMDAFSKWRTANAEQVKYPD